MCAREGFCTACARKRANNCANEPFFRPIVPQRVPFLWICASKGMDLGPNYVPVRVGASWRRPSRGIDFLAEQPRRDYKLWLLLPGDANIKHRLPQARRPYVKSTFKLDLYFYQIYIRLMLSTWWDSSSSLLGQVHSMLQYRPVKLMCYYCSISWRNGNRDLETAL